MGLGEFLGAKHVKWKDMESPDAPAEPVLPPPKLTRNWWTWLVFGALAGLVVASNLGAIFDPKARAEADPAAAEIQAAPTALKQFAAMEDLKRLAKQTGSRSPDAGLDGSESSLDGTIRSLKAKSSVSDGAAEWLLALQAVNGETLDRSAIDKLLKSEDPGSQRIGQSFAGELSDPSQIHGDDPPQNVARWIASHPGEDKVPVEATGVKVNAIAFAAIFGYLAAIFLGGVASIVAYIVLKKGGSLPARGYQTGLSLAGTDARGGRMAIYFGVFLTISAIPSVLAAAVPSLKGALIPMLAGVYVVMILLTPVFCTIPLFGDRIAFRGIIGDRSDLLKKLGWGLCGYMANFPLFLLALLVTAPLQKVLPPPSHEIIEMVKGSNPINQLLLYFVAAAAAPLIEEPMFRGVLFPALQRLFASPTMAIILTGCVFGVIHPQGPALWLPLALIGMTAAVLTRQTGSLIPAILMHFLHNTTIYIFSLILA